MNKDKIIDLSTELAQYANELAKDSGVPGIGLIGYLSHFFFDKYLESRFRAFFENANVDIDFLMKVSKNEDYSNCLYSSLETVRRTHSKIGLVVLALIYKDYWDKPDFLISAMRAFAEISDKTIITFIQLYESISEKDDGILDSFVINNSEHDYYKNYNIGVELINRNFFLQTTCSSVGNNNPIQGVVWENTKIYYRYCKEAIRLLNSR